jgi:hydrogenase expression/formation protein HypC
MGVIDVVGVQREVSLLLVENPQVGDWVIVHAGFAIQIIDEATAQESLRYLREAAQLLVENDDSGTAANG